MSHTLSSTATRSYWLGRYLERAESTARLISVQANLLMDLPKRLPLSPPIVFRYLSGDHANYRGVDFGLRYRFLPGWELTSQGSYVLGDAAKVEILRVDLASRHLDLRIVR